MSRKEFRQRIGIFVLGIAIGLLILGMLNAAKQARMNQIPPASQPAPAALPAQSPAR